MVLERYVPTQAIQAAVNGREAAVLRARSAVPPLSSSHPTGSRSYNVNRAGRRYAALERLR